MDRRYLIFLVLFLAGCLGGQIDYTGPSSAKQVQNSKTINKPRDAVWNAAVPALGKQFFVINNLDKSSGFINLSYSGDPESYVDCGRVVSTVENARGKRTYNFPAAKADERYETAYQGRLYIIHRTMKLEGRMNLVFEELGPSATRVTANTRYVISRTRDVQVAGGGSQTVNDSISFNTGSSASFAAGPDGRATECVSTGKLEREVLSLVN